MTCIFFCLFASCFRFGFPMLDTRQNYAYEQTFCTRPEFIFLDMEWVMSSKSHVACIMRIAVINISLAEVKGKHSNLGISPFCDF